MRLRWFGVLAVVMALALSACYLPTEFRAELRIGKNGDFALSYEGDLIWIPLLSDIRLGKVKPQDVAQKIALYEKDLKRDPNFTTVTSKGEGRFGVKYQRYDHLGDSQLVTFVRRNAAILALKGKPDGTMVVWGNISRSADYSRLAKLNLDLRGEFRVVTDAHVKEHNASEVRPFGAYMVYIWHIENNLSPPPRLVLIRDTGDAKPTAGAIKK